MFHLRYNDAAKIDSVNYNTFTLYISFVTDILFNETTCSNDSFMRGPGQNVVGFCLYGDINTPEHKTRGIHSRPLELNNK